MADEPWLKYQTQDQPAGGLKPWEKYAAPPAQATAPAATSPIPSAAVGGQIGAKPWEKYNKTEEEPKPGMLERAGTAIKETGTAIQDWWKSQPSALEQMTTQTAKDTERYQKGGVKEMLKGIDDPEAKNILGGFAGSGLIKGVKVPPIGQKLGLEIEKRFSPTTVSSIAGEAEASIRKAGGQAVRSTEQTAAEMEPFHKVVNSLSDSDRLNFIDNVEGGHGPVRSEINPLASRLKEAYKLRRDKLEAMPAHAKAEFIEEYYPHHWKDPNAARTGDVGGGGASKQGSGASLKKRDIPTIADGLKRGLEPLTTDPIEATMRYVSSMDRFIAQQEVFNAAKDEGTIKFVRPKVMGASGSPDSFKVPEGYVALNGRGARNINGEQAYAPADWARVYNNYIDQGFHTKPESGKLYDAIQGVSNSITGLELGLSGYHAFTMGLEGIITDTAKGISQLVGGKPITALGSIAKAPLSPVTRYLSGKKGEQIYLGRTPGTPDLRRVVDLQTAAGGRAVGKGHSPDYRFTRMGSYWTAFKRGALKAELAQSAANIKAAPITGGGKEFFKAIGRVMETVAAPLFEKYIPRVKNGAFYDTMGAWVKENPTATYDQQVAMARKVWDSIDNRFGEMVQDNIFWNKTMKQSAQVAMRSYSWNMGTVREIGGGAASLLKDPSRVSIKHPDYDPRAAYVVAMPIVVGTVNAAYQYLKTGKMPESPEDLVAPRTGGTAPGFGGRGEVEERAMLPGYHKDILGWWNDAKQEAINKVAKGPSMAGEMLLRPGGPKDFTGKHVVDPAQDATTQLGQYLKWVVDSVTPISVKGLIQGQKTGSALSPAAGVMGARPAPGWLQDPEGTKRGMAAIQRKESKAKRKSDLRRERQYGGPQE